MSRPEDLIVKTVDEFEITDMVLNVKHVKFACDNHGDLGLTFTMLHPFAAIDGDLLPPLTPIKIVDPALPFWAWRGRVKAPGGKPWPGGQRFEFACEGMQASARDQIVRNELIYPSGRNIGELFREVGEGYVPDVFCSGAESEATSQRVMHERSEDFVFATPFTIWETLAPLGADQAPLIWEIYSLGSDSQPSLYTKSRPTSPAYFAVMESTSNIYGEFRGGADLDVEGDASIVRNRVSVKYRNENTGSGYKIFTEGGAGTLIGGAIKDLGIDINRMTISRWKVIEHAARAMLAHLANPQNTGRSIRLPYPCTVREAAGPHDQVPLWALRPNNVIKILDYNSGFSGLGNEFYIEQTAWDEDARMQVLTTGPVR